MDTARRPCLTSREVAKLLRVSPDKVLGWIRRGQLKAVNVSNRVRPQYRVGQDDLDAFLAAREVQRLYPRSHRPLSLRRLQSAPEENLDRQRVDPLILPWEKNSSRRT